MAQEEKDLVLKDISARLYYGVKISVPVIEKNMIFTVVGISESWLRVKNDRGSIFNVNTALEFKPYYRPISSMTEEEIIEFNNIPSTKNYTIIENDLPWDVAHYKQIDWLNKKMFDYRGFIRSGSALEAPEGMFQLPTNEFVGLPMG